MYDVAIIGGDVRQSYLAEYLFEKGISVITYCVVNFKCKDINNYIKKAHSLSECIDTSKVLILPIPICKNNNMIFASEVKNDMTIDNLINMINYKYFGKSEYKKLNCTLSDYLPKVFGGIFPCKLKMFCNNHNISIHDFTKDDDIMIINAVSTAEGAILEAIKNSNIVLHKSKCLVTGYGRCAKILADKLKGLNADVCIAARKNIDLIYAESLGYNILHISQLKDNVKKFDYIFNTIPSIIFNASILEKVNKNATIIDIASKPGGVDFEFANEIGICAYLCLGLPGKYAPKVSAEILGNKIISII